jgi:hypothetical protein
VPGKTHEKRIRNNNNNNNNNIRNITHYKESATIRKLEPEWWGSPLVQKERYQEKPVKRDEIIIIIIIGIKRNVL